MVEAGTDRPPYIELLNGVLSWATDAVGANLKNDPSFEQLAPRILAEKYRGFASGWRCRTQVEDAGVELDLLLPKHFPFDPPVVYVANGGKGLFLTNPHVDRDGRLCTISHSASVDSSQPAALVLDAVRSARDVLSDSPADDFRDEFLSYWALSEERAKYPFFLVDPVATLPERPVVALLGGRVLIGKEMGTLIRWAKNWSNERPEFLEEGGCLVLRRERPLLPHEYPGDLPGLRTLVKRTSSTCAQLVDAHLCNSSRFLVILIVQDIDDGYALGGILTKGLALARDKGATRGFRPGRIPQELLFKRAVPKLRGGHFMRRTVQRVDPEWIHSRGGSGMALADRRIVMIGCGSVGGYVAHLLARAGVGHITLVDPEVLSWDNVGRHVLGAADVGRPKAEALATSLQSALPHLEVIPVSQDWRDWISGGEAIVEGVDLIVSTAATWSCEEPLNLVARRSAFPPMLFGWLEPFALAGHALTVARDGGCLQCGMNQFGKFDRAVVAFVTDQLKKEPGGCTFFQEYGPVQMMHVVALIAEAAVAALGSPPRHSSLSTYVAGEVAIQNHGGTLSKAWQDRVPRSAVQWTIEELWTQNPACRVCQP